MIFVEWQRKESYQRFLSDGKVVVVVDVEVVDIVAADEAVVVVVAAADAIMFRMLAVALMIPLLTTLVPSEAVEIPDKFWRQNLKQAKYDFENVADSGRQDFQEFGDHPLHHRDLFLLLPKHSNFLVFIVPILGW